MPTPRDSAQHIATVVQGINSTASLLGLDRPPAQPTYGGTPVLDEERAALAETIVKAWLDKRGGWGEHARRYPPGHEGPMWVVSLEGGPEDWPMRICSDMYEQWPDGVFAEPVTSWCLGFYPA